MATRHRLLPVQRRLQCAFEAPFPGIQISIRANCQTKLSIRIRALKNIGSSWLSLGVNVVVSIILTPLILHHLGDDAYGLWALVFSFAGYFNIFDFGLSSAVVRYVARFNATHDYEQLKKYVNTILFLFACTSAVLLVGTLAVAWYVTSVFHIAPALQKTAQLLFLLVGCMFALQFSGDVFLGIIAGIQEFWWEYLIQTVAGIFRLILIVAALEHGGGLLSISIIAICLSVSSYIAYIVIAYRRLPLRFFPKFSDFQTLKEILRYSTTTFSSVVAGGLTSTAGNTILGIFMSTAAITPFAIATKFIQYANRVVQSSSQIFTPMSSHFDATGELGRLRRVLTLGNRTCAFLAFPAFIGILFLGRSAIEVWVGAKYSWCYDLLLVLAVPHTLQFAQLASPKILYGMARHMTLGKARLVEAVANIVLSIVLLRYYGIWGVVWGTAIPKFIACVFFLPGHLCHILKMSVRSFLWEAYMWPTVICVPMTVILYLLHRRLVPHTLMPLVMETLAGILVYGLTLLGYVLIKEPEGIKLRKRFLKFRSEALNR
jgi:O-antigen/teichoic acid export membrane protein